VVQHALKQPDADDDPVHSSQTSTLEPLSSEILNDEAILLEVDLQDTASVLRFFPLKQGCGEKKMVLLHIRVYDVDFRKTYRKIRKFRSMDQEDQELEMKWCESQRTEKSDRRLYGGRIAAMEATKKAIQDQISRTDETPRTVSPEIDEPSALPPAPPPDIVSITNAVIRPSPVRPSTGALSLLPPPYEAPPYEEPPYEEPPDEEPPVGEPPAGELVRSHIGLFSPAADRVQRAGELALQNPKKRKKASFSEHPKQLASAYVMKTLQQALMSVAEAADAMHCPTNVSSGPLHRLVLIVLCDVKETDPNGGELTRYHHDIP
jgi:hypothetical protein